MREIANKKVLIIIPAHNEEHNIGSVLNEVREEIPFADVVVVNDGSTDTTPRIPKRMGFTVLDLPFNLGIGGAMQTGFKYAMEGDYDIAVQVDGDGQHDPRSVPELITPLVENQADVVVGSRHIEDRGYKTPFTRRFGMHLFSQALSLILGQRITDTTSGFRGLNREAIEFFAENYPTDYPEVEALVIAHFAGLRIKEVPASMRVRQKGRSSITPFQAAYYMTKVLLATFIWLIRQKPTRRKEVG